MTNLPSEHRPPPASRLARARDLAPQPRRDPGDSLWTLCLYLAMLVGLALSASAATGCGAPATPWSPVTAPLTDATAADADDDAGDRAPAPHEAEAGPPRDLLRRDRIDRARLDAVLDQGPGMFLRGVEVAPRFRSSAFAGWEIVQFWPGETRFDPYDLRPGDVILTVNGVRVERPHHLYEVWTALRAADAVVVVVERAGQPFEIRFDVVSAAPARGSLAP